MLLSEILDSVDHVAENFTDSEITDITYDSRTAKNGSLFVALVGTSSDGHDYIRKAYENGARAFICERSADLPADAAVIKVADSRATLGRIAENFFGHPETEMKIIGVTGTKGKTSVTHILKNVLDECGIKAGVIGTMGAFYDGIYEPTVNTTPESFEILRFMRKMLDRGCRAICMEVSSIGLKQHRVDTIRFDIAVFTNLSVDHIGGHEHDSFEEYAFWKKQLFKKCDFALLNSDDPFSEEIIKEIGCEFKTYGTDEKSDYRAGNIRPFIDEKSAGMRFDCAFGEKTLDILTSMPGLFSVYNALSIYAVASRLGAADSDIIKAVKDVKVKGRVEIVEVPAPYKVMIDYAHNGISMKSILEAARSFDPKRIITVFGSVGDRAQIRREELGLVSGELSDHSILTTDDPGFEDPVSICREIASFIEQKGGSYEIIADRRQAVHKALEMGREGDIILILGKGHETVQKIRGEKIYYSDHESVESFFNSGKVK